MGFVVRLVNRRRSLRALAASVLRSTAAIVWLLALGRAADAQPATDCVQAGRAAAASAGLPRGLLPAVGRVESGRVDPGRGEVMPWPWTIDVAGQGRFFPDKQSVVRATRALLASGQRNIDVGCYQISLLHHPFAFSDLDQAFDPAANADYAARFLAALRDRHGNWAAAVAAYHSADPALGNPYRDLVFAAWRPEPQVQSPEIGFVPVPSVHVWSPRPAGTAPRLITLHAQPPRATPLPRVVTPNG